MWTAAKVTGGSFQGAHFAYLGDPFLKDDCLAKLNGTETDTATPGHTTRGTRASDWLHFARNAPGEASPGHFRAFFVDGCPPESRVSVAGFDFYLFK
jgi:hypothetical protein